MLHWAMLCHWHPTGTGRIPWTRTEDSPTVRADAAHRHEEILTNSDPEEVIDRYLRRWEIQTLFGALKSRGFDLEATHLRALGRIRKLKASLSLTLTWALRVVIHR